MKKLLFAITFTFLFLSSGISQGYFFGPKLGGVMGFQSWNEFQRNPLLTYHGDIFIETLDENRTGALYASLGYHERGSSTGGFFRGTNFSARRRFVWQNAVLAVGAKKKLNTRGNLDPYYMVGVRLEYTFATNLDERESNFDYFFIIEERTNRFNYGVSLGGGFEFRSNEFAIPFIEFSINPDISFQYESEFLGSVTANGPFGPISINVPERKIRNMSIEITLGYKFMRKVVYVN